MDPRRTVRGLGRYRTGASLPGPSVRPQSHPLRADKQAPQPPSSRPLRHREDSQADSQKLLLADATMRHQGLRQGMQRLFGFKGSPPQAIRRASILAHFYSLVERPVNGLCHRPPNLSQLEKRQLRLDIGHCRRAHKNGTLQASQGHNRCTGSSKDDHRYSCTSLRSFGVNCHGLRLTFHIQILVLTMLLPRTQ